MSILEEEDYSDLMVKLVLLGESGVGKTNIFERYSTNMFSENTLATIGMDFTSVDRIIDDKRVKVQIWDTAGSEQYRSIAQSYYQITHGILLVYEVSNKKSFEKIKYWLDQIHQNCGNDIKIILLGNKIDLIDSRVVSIEEGKTFAEENKIFFKEVSAKENKEGEIEEAFTIIIKECMNMLEEERKNEDKELLQIARRNTKPIRYSQNSKEVQPKKSCCQLVLSYFIQNKSSL